MSVTEVDFQGWPKTPRLFRDCTITEKIDGTNACVTISPALSYDTQAITAVDGYHVYAQSRKRMITPASDNYGFAAWVRDNADGLLAALGPGRHFGEWWGLGIQRGYGQADRTFSLFNTSKWMGADLSAVDNLCVVPQLYIGPFRTGEVFIALDELARYGSVAAEGYGHPEGVCVYHHASHQVFKATLEDDHLPRGSPAPQAIRAA